MKSSKGLLRNSLLYVIIDKGTCPKKYSLDLALNLSLGGAGLVQLRDKRSSKASLLKEASILSKYFRKTQTLFIVNDYLDVAKISDADGVHLGQDDTPIEIAREILGRDKIIGISCHTLAQALDAQIKGADYVSIGPLFKTPTKAKASPIKKELLSLAKATLRIPFFCIGGINQGNLTKVKALGAQRIAVCRAVLCAKRPFKAARKLLRLLKP